MEQQIAIEAAANEAGIKEVQFLLEPTAAAVAYGLNLQLKEEDRILVFDIGPTSIDATILKIKDNFFEKEHAQHQKVIGNHQFT